MTDYELYQLLDENGYEPSEENLAILKENLNEGLLYAGHQGRKLAKHSALLAGYKEKIENLTKKRDELPEGDPGITKIEKQIKELEEKSKVSQGKVDSAKEYAADKAASGHSMRLNVMYKNANAKAEKQAELNNKRKYLANYEAGKPDTTLEESLDIITNLLESNGFEASDENIITLCENIVNDECAVLDSADVILTEGMDPDYVYMQILDNNDFEVSESNIAVLKEAIDNGHILLA